MIFSLLFSTITCVPEGECLVRILYSKCSNMNGWLVWLFTNVEISKICGLASWLTDHDA